MFSQLYQWVLDHKENEGARREVLMSPEGNEMFVRTLFTGYKLYSADITVAITIIMI